MKPSRLHRKTWLSVREAASRIGRELLGTEWSDQLLDQIASTQPVKDIVRDLYTALSSGEVRTLVGDGSHDLDPRHATWLGFKIDLRKNRIEVGELQVWSYCELNASDLDKFLSKYKDTRFSAVNGAQRREECADWLRQLMLRPKTKSKDTFKEQAKTRFSISGRAFEALWKKIAAETGGRWSKAGRPKSER